MLEGRVAICAGAGRGVGAEVAKLMAAHGAKVVVNDPGTSGSGEGSDRTPAQEIVDQIKAAGGEATANYGSVAKFDDCLAMVQQARDTFGGLHIVFDAAGILRDKMFHNMFPEDWQAVIDVHLTGHFNINRAAINLFREQNYGRMIMVSSTSGLLGNVGQCNYGAAKLGIVALARIVAMENASRGITVNVICPSADTRMTRSVPTPKDPQAAALREERLRRSRADAIAPLCVFLASEQAAKSTARCFTSAPANCRSMAICGRCGWCTARAAGPRRPWPKSRSRHWRRNSLRSTAAPSIRACRWSNSAVQPRARARRAAARHCSGPAAGVDADPLHRSGVAAQLLRQNLRSGVGGVAAAGADALGHRLRPGFEPQAENGTPAWRAISAKERRCAGVSETASMIDRIPGGERGRRLSAQGVVDPASDLGRIGLGRQPGFGRRAEQQLADHVAAQDTGAGPQTQFGGQAGGEGRFAAAAQAADRDQPAVRGSSKRSARSR